TNADDWMMLESKSPIDDSPSITLLKSAEQGNQALVIRCRENKTDAYILTENYLSDESENVLLRYDESKAESHKLSLSTDKKALFFNPAISNIKAIMAAKRIIVRYRIYNGTQI